jgi:hypothetical protein
VTVDFEENGKNDVITFEGKRFEKKTISPQLMPQLGLAFKEEAVTNGRRMAVYIPQQKVICLLDNYINNTPNEEITYRLIKKKKVVAS